MSGLANRGAVLKRTAVLYLQGPFQCFTIILQDQFDVLFVSLKGWVQFRMPFSANEHSFNGNISFTFQAI